MDLLQTDSGWEKHELSAPDIDSLPAIDSLEDALILYNDAVAYQFELQKALAAAMDRLREAMEDVHKTQGRLGKADFQLGRTRYILRKNGYGEILGKKRGQILKVNGRDRFTVRLD